MSSPLGHARRSSWRNESTAAEKRHGRMLEHYFPSCNIAASMIRNNLKATTHCPAGKWWRTSTRTQSGPTTTTMFVTAGVNSGLFFIGDGILWARVIFVLFLLEWRDRFRQQAATEWICSLAFLPTNGQSAVLDSARLLIPENNVCANPCKVHQLATTHQCVVIGQYLNTFCAKLLITVWEPPGKRCSKPNTAIPKKLPNMNMADWRQLAIFKLCFPKCYDLSEVVHERHQRKLRKKW